MEALKALLESNAISEQLKVDIEEAWNQKVSENRQSVTAELREEFSRKYNHDLSVMVENIDQLITDRLTVEMEEFHEDRLQLAEAKVGYAKALRENTDLMKQFVTESLARELAELHQDRKNIASKFAVFENFIVDQLAKEIAEFHEDKLDLAETKVRLVRESKNHLNKVKLDFVRKSAAMVAETVERGLTAEIKQLKEDIDVARKNDFGRKIFEAFSAEYSHSHLNENSEMTKLMRVLAIKDRQLAEANKNTVRAQKLAESKQRRVQQLTEAADRERVMNELLSPLSKDQRSLMTTLLETTQTSRLRTAFEKYLPAVIDGSVPPAKEKAILSEGKEITGNRIKNDNSSIAGGEVIDIKRLAGIK